MSKYQTLLFGRLFWLSLLVWVWYHILSEEINPLRSANIALGVIVTFMFCTELVRNFISEIKTELYLRVAQTAISSLGIGFIAGVIVFGTTTLAIPNIFADYFAELIGPLILFAIVTIGLVYEIVQNVRKIQEKSVVPDLVSATTPANM